MPLDLATLQTVSARCAPSVAIETMLSVVQVESGGDPLAIGINGRIRRAIAAPSADAAAAMAMTLIAQGRSVDLGLAQINSRNLGRLGLSIPDAFDPCRNLSAAADLMQADYARSASVEADSQAALRMTLSYYNTGNPSRGIANGYVARVFAAAKHVVPALRIEPAPQRPPPAVAATWDVFATRPSAEFVIHPAASGEAP